MPLTAEPPEPLSHFGLLSGDLSLSLLKERFGGFCDKKTAHDLEAQMDERFFPKEIVAGSSPVKATSQPCGW